MLDDVYDTRGGLNEPKQKVKGGGVTFFGEIGLNDWLTARSITAYRKDDSRGPIDFEALPTVDVDVPGLYANTQFSQEVQLVADSGPLQGLIGAYYLNADARTAFDVRAYTTGAVLGPIFSGLTLGTDSRIGTKTWAVFADLTYDISDQFSLSAGGRYTEDKRKGDIVRKTYIGGGSPSLAERRHSTWVSPSPPRPTSTKSARTRPSLRVLRFRSSRMMITTFTRVTRGASKVVASIRAARLRRLHTDARGHIRIYGVRAGNREQLRTRLERIGNQPALELGNCRLLRRLQGCPDPGVCPLHIHRNRSFCGLTSNAGKAVFKGVELESPFRAGENLFAESDRFTLSGSLGYLDAEFKEYVSVVAFGPDGTPIIPAQERDVSDFREVQNTPTWTLSGTIDYDVPISSGRLNFNTTVSYRSSSQQFEIAIPELDQGGFALWDANLVWRAPGNRWTLGLHGKNLLDKQYIVAGYNFYNQNPFTGEFILPTGSLDFLPRFAGKAC